MHLVLISTSGNQSYIFASNRLREAVGASHLLAVSTTEWVADAAGRVGGTVLQASSGSTLVVVPDEQAARVLVREVTTRALRETPGLAVHGVGTAIAGAAPTSAEVDDLFQRHRQHVAGRPSHATRHQRLPVVAACASTDSPAASWHADARSTNELALTSPLSAEVIAKRMARLPARAKLATLVPNRRLVDIDTFFGAVEWVAVIHADGNQLGAFFRAAADELGAAEVAPGRSALGVLSEQVQEVANESFRDAVDELARLAEPGVPLPLVPLVVGGDDLTVLVDGYSALPFTRSYLEAFARHGAGHGLVGRVLGALGRDVLTASAGVAIVKPHFPFSVAYGLSEELCRNAKGALAAEPGNHGLDVHILIDSTVSDLESIRKRYEVDGVVLTERPFLIGAGSAVPPADRDWHEVLERLKLITTAPRGGDGAVVTRTQLHALREELRGDLGRARRRLAELDARVPATGDERRRLDALRGDDGLARGLLDLLELAPFVVKET